MSCDVVYTESSTFEVKAGLGCRPGNDNDISDRDE